MYVTFFCVPHKGTSRLVINNLSNNELLHINCSILLKTLVQHVSPTIRQPWSKQHIVPSNIKGCICQSGRYTPLYPRGQYVILWEVFFILLEALSAIIDDTVSQIKDGHCQIITQHYRQVRCPLLIDGILRNHFIYASRLSDSLSPHITYIIRIICANE